MNVRTRLTTALLVVSVALVLGAGALIATRVFADKEAIRADVTERLADWTGGKVTISGPVRVFPFPIFRLEFDGLVIQAPDLPHVGAIEARTVRLELATGSLLRGSPKLNRIELDAPRIVTTDDPTETEATAREPSHALLRLLRGAPAPELEITDGSLVLAGQTGSNAVTDISAEFQFRRSGATSGEGSFVWRNEAVPFELATQAPSAVAQAVQVPMRLKFGHGRVAAQIRGTAAIGGGVRLGGSAEVAIPDLRAFGDWVGFPMTAGRGLREFRASGNFNWTGEYVEFDKGAFGLDGNSASGSLTLGYGTARPAISGTLALETLTLAPYLGGGGGSTDGRGPIDFALAREVDIDLRLSASRLSAPPVSTGQTALTLGVENGAVAADLAILSVCGGKADIRLEGELARTTPAWRLSGAISGIAVKPCVDLISPPSLIGGTGSLAVDVRGTGRTLEDLFTSAEGGLSLAVTDGEADIDFLKIVGQARRNALKGWDAVRGNPTQFERLEARCTARAGVAWCSGLEAESGSTRIAGTGTFDLAARRLDWRLHLDNDLADRRPRMQQLVTRLVDAVQVQGSWFEPTFAIAGHNSGHRQPDPRTIDHASASGVR